jgi:hypothetical protein
MSVIGIMLTGYIIGGLAIIYIITYNLNRHVTYGMSIMCEIYLTIGIYLRPIRDIRAIRSSRHNLSNRSDTNEMSEMYEMTNMSNMYNMPARVNRYNLENRRMDRK